MIADMLQAVSEMLDFKKEEDTKIILARINCAKIMLDKIISGMKTEGMTNITLPYGKPQPKINDGKAQNQRSDVQLVVDGGFIKEVKNALESTKIELDGVAYPWKEVIGKSFTSGRVL
jgi:hypothetical protein